MLKLSEFRHNHPPCGGEMLAKFIRRGIRESYKPLRYCTPFADSPAQNKEDACFVRLKE